MADTPTPITITPTPEALAELAEGAERVRRMAEPTAREVAEALPYAVVCYSRCWSCQFDCHFSPPQAHSWMDQEDAEHAGHPWPLPQEIADDNQCACDCAGRAAS